MGQIQMWLIDFLHTLFPANIWNWTYFSGLWQRYASVSGFIIGVIIMKVIYNSSDGDKKRGIIRIFAIVAFVNALDGVYKMLMGFVNTYILGQSQSIYETYIHGAFNPLSVMIVVLIISECYRNKSKLAFYFGLSTFSVGILISGSIHTDEAVLLYLVIRVLVAALLCAIGSKITYSFVMQLVMGIFFLVTETVQAYILTWRSHREEEAVTDLIAILFSYKAEILIICAIVIVFAVFELFILTENKITIKDLSLPRALISILVCLVLSGGVVYGAYRIDLEIFEKPEDVVEEKNNQMQVEETSKPITYMYTDVNVVGAEASSHLVSKSGNTYNIEFTMDGSIETCWQDGQSTDGAGETLTYVLEQTVLLSGLEIINGNMKTESKYYENNRIESARVLFYLDGTYVGEEVVEFVDDYASQPHRFELSEYWQCNSVVIVVDSIYAGSRYNDLCVSEVLFEQAIAE